MSVFIICDGSISVNAANRPSCSGDWIEIQSTEIIQGGVTPAEWEIIGDGLTLILVSVGVFACLYRLINIFQTRDQPNE